MKTITGWTPITEQYPPWDEEVLILTGDGKVRTGRLDGLAFYGWRLTDCTHPMQNCILSFEDTAWRND
jgi:hypothetical protein